MIFLRSLFSHADEECQEMDENARRNKNIRERGVSCFNEALPILQYICCKLDEAQKCVYIYVYYIISLYYACFSKAYYIYRWNFADYII